MKPQQVCHVQFACGPLSVVQTIIGISHLKPSSPAAHFSSIFASKSSLQLPFTMAMRNGLKTFASKLNSAPSVSPKSVNRAIHSTSVKNMGGGHGHDEPYYLHAKHMYNLDRMKNQKLTMSLAVLTAFSIGVGVPIFAVVFQQKKTASG